ncbi:MAG: di-heme oxidoredictase family protein, partial [Myxococcota bacterium]|nr:di-heme oxidoredictase family protein [Myxococcota bacterium]
AEVFDKSVIEDMGLNAHFNADSCRACHQDPILGGAGGLDVNVLRYGFRDPESGEYTSLSESVLPRSALWTELPAKIDAQANIVEWRNPPLALGMGYFENRTEAEILAFADPYDADGDGISGRGHILSDGRLGRYGWKADIPSLSDFVADALIKELGMTVEPSLSDFTVADDFDSCPDPELPDSDFQALLFFLQELEAPKGQDATIDGDPEAGAVLFEQVSCGKCHLASVPSYTDLLLHDVAPNPAILVDIFPDVLPTEYRTPPLWGLIHTGPYLHDGSAPTLEDAILMGHYGEAQGSRQAFESLSEQDKNNLLSFLSTL